VSSSSRPARQELSEVERQLHAAEAELNRVRTQLAQVKASSAYRLGTALVRAARRPGRAAVTLPRDVLEIYRLRRSSRPRPAAAASGLADGPGAQTPSRLAPRSSSVRPREEIPGDPLGDLVALALPAQLAPRATVAVAGVLHPATERALGGELCLSPVLPDGGRQVLERISPDLLLVDATATAVGAWWGVGTYIAPSREHRLAGLVAAAREMGVRTVLWNPLGPGRVPALHEVVEFDLVLDGTWSPGIRMADHYADPAAARSLELLAAGDPSRLSDAPEIVAELTALVPDGLRLVAHDLLGDPGTVPPALAPAALDVGGREPPWAEARLAVPLATLPAVAGGDAGALAWDAVAAALTAGAVAVAAHPPLELAPFVATATSAASLRQVVRSARDAGAVPAPTHLSALRAVFTEHSVHRRVLTLLDLAQVVAPPTLSAGRGVSVLTVQPSERTDAVALIDAWSAQTQRPAELVVAVPSGADGAWFAAAAASAGLTVRLLPQVSERPWWLEAARVAGQDLVHVSSGLPADRDVLLTLLALREATEADAVGPAGVTASLAPQPIRELAVDGALLRRTLLLDSLPCRRGGIAAQTLRRGRLVGAPPLMDARGVTT
jgi:hypothetical protein